MLSDVKGYGLTVAIIATKVLPTLVPVLVSPAIDLDEVSLALKRPLLQRKRLKFKDVISCEKN